MYFTSPYASASAMDFNNVRGSYEIKRNLTTKFQIKTETRIAKTYFLGHFPNGIQ